MTETQLPSGEIKQSIPIDSLNVVAGIESMGVIVDDREGISGSLDVLRNEFGIEDSGFSTVKSRLTLTAIADKLNRVEKDGGHSFGNKTAELEYIADLVMLAVGPHTAYAEQYKATMDEPSVVTTEGLKKAYDRFTQPELSKEMADFLHDSDFDEQRQRLGIKSTDEEDPFRVRVLSIESEFGTESHGLIPHIDYGEEKLPFEEWLKLQKENQTRLDYTQGLKNNGKALQEAVGRETQIAPAWVVTYEDGSRDLCIPSSIAEKILYPDEERASYYNDAERQRDIAVLKHEYTHTQKMLLFDENIGLGIALEELRAEHFSGDKQGYTDIKKFFMGMGMLTGYSPKKSFEIDGHPYDEEKFFEDIAKNIGLDGLLDAITVIPSNYVQDEHANPYLKSLVQNNGGSLSAHFDKTYKRISEQTEHGVLDDRVSVIVDKIRETFKDNEIGSVEQYAYYGGISSLGRIISENFRLRYPDESDGYDYENHKKLSE